MEVVEREETMFARDREAGRLLQTLVPWVCWLVLLVRAKEKKNVNIDTVRFSHILETGEFVGLNYFLPHAAFVVSHKNESVETLLGVLWYLPVNSPIIVVTNCPEGRLEEIKRSLAQHLTRHTRTYLVHQKDATIANFFRECGVNALLDPGGKVVDGKGEGMYIGTLFALLLGYPQWVISYDADKLCAQRFAGRPSRT